ncbi:MAG: hypothetical protein CVU12_00660 [Bacteroidetes bacterium HGW-Bacteroidetes-7]|jgi:hypothetical protein|nr:MAG: hypothetical protein CVU12_00660 [Bacteroidetes bacterium HGW-Bacteroidetes-7]
MKNRFTKPSRFRVTPKLLAMMFVIGVFGIIAISCTKQAAPPVEEQEGVAVLSYTRFLEQGSSHYVINKASVSGDNLEIEISASGCSGMTWKVGLVDSEIIAKSLPIQRYMRVTFENMELCLAYFTKKYTFDLKPIRVQGYNKIHINLNNWHSPLIYSY